MDSENIHLCKKCHNFVHIYNDSYIKCNVCSEYIHLSCIPSNLFESGITGDVFFLYTCWECSTTKEDVITRDKISWFMAIVLAFHDMSCKNSGISNQGFFHWKTHIISFIDRNWQTLFSSNIKRRRNWLGTIAGILSHNSPSFFLSGVISLRESGWWKLSHELLPGVYVKLYTDMIIVRNKIRNKYKNNPSSMKKDELIVLQLLESYGLKMQYEAYKKTLKSIAEIGVSRESENYSSEDENKPSKILHLDTEENIDMINKNFFKTDSKLYSSSELLDNLNIDTDESCSSFNQVDSILKSEDLFDFNFSFDNIISDIDFSNDFILNENINPAAKSENKLEDFLPVKSLFNVNEKPRVKPWDYNFSQNIDTKVLPLSEYQEHEILKKLKLYLEIIDNNSQLLQSIDAKKLCEARRLCCKLNVRKHLRKQNVQFNLDKLAKGISTEDAKLKVRNDTNVLDKFQIISTPDIENVSFATRLTGVSVWSCFVSPYTNRILKPFIRRDYETVSPWGQLMNQIKMKVCNEPAKRAPIDYCYVRPHHIAVINSLCEQFYWPGINVSDVLQYPDYTVVALYKKLVVGFGLLVPDANHNEAYISFFWTRPNWQRCGIGTFMLYHLIQTCMGKDITLHVSATNTALILYQKFGFKVEEFIQDFYDKYMPISSRECKHALFLRLSR